MSTQAAVPVVHHEVAAERPRREVINTARAVRHVAHDHCVRLRESVITRARISVKVALHLHGLV